LNIWKRYIMADEIRPLAYDTGESVVTYLCSEIEAFDNRREQVEKIIRQRLDDKVPIHDARQQVNRRCNHKTHGSRMYPS
jgi:hypothetical protein